MNVKTHVKNILRKEAEPFKTGHMPLFLYLNRFYITFTAIQGKYDSRFHIIFCILTSLKETNSKRKTRKQ